MARPTIRSPAFSAGSIRFSAITSMLSQVGPASTEGNFSSLSFSDSTGYLRVVEQLAAVRAIQPVVEVVPPVTLALARGP